MSALDRLSSCGQQVRRHDHDRYLTSLFAPADRREALFAIAAFNLEVAKTREVVSEPMLGRIRLQWWRESIDGIYDGRVRRHEVVEPLAHAVDHYDLTRGHFDRVIDAREFDLEDRAPVDLAELESYAEATAAPLMWLALEALGVRDGPAHRAAWSVAIAVALTGLLRAIPFHARQRRVYLPTAVVADVAVEMGELFELRPHAGLARAVERLAAVARRHLDAGRALRRETPRRALPALLPATLADGHLKALARARYDVFDRRVQTAHPLRQIRLIWRALAGGY